MTERETEKSTQTKLDQFLVEYKGRTFDISEFFALHPGGKKLLRPFRNQNIEKVLAEHLHSKAAYHIFEEFSLSDQKEDDHLENLIDWDSPILWQVGSLAGHYWDWVNLPVNRTIRLFESETLEFVSITPWYLILTIWFPAVIFFLYRGCSTHTYQHNVDLAFEILISLGLGILLWTFIEYVFHRKLFHFRPPEDSKVLITLHFLLHGVHHKAPFDNRRLLFPPVVGMIVAAIVWNIYEAIFPSNMVNFVAAGTTAGYLFYDLTHYYLHFGKPKVGSYFYTLKRSHNYHHFSHHNQGFGVSGQFWDYIFKTDITLRTLMKPIEW